MNKELFAFILALMLGAIGASAKAILDVESLKADNQNSKDMFREIKQELRLIRVKLYE